LHGITKVVCGSSKFRQALSKKFRLCVLSH
jgi:hypothetical protein